MLNQERNADAGNGGSGLLQHLCNGGDARSTGSPPRQDGAVLLEEEAVSFTGSKPGIMKAEEKKAAFAARPKTGVMQVSLTRKLLPRKVRIPKQRADSRSNRKTQTPTMAQNLDVPLISKDDPTFLTEALDLLQPSRNRSAIDPKEGSKRSLDEANAPCIGMFEDGRKKESKFS